MGVAENAIICLALVTTTAAQGRDIAVPSVGCPSDGQIGPEPAPQSGTVRLPLEAGTADSLAYYHASELSVLAPRGWHCLQLIGSNGSFLVVTQKIEDLPKPGKADRTIKGMGIELAVSIGGTSGRFEVAPVAARLFPRARKFAASVSAELKDMKMPSKFANRPWPDDHLVRRGRDVVEYETPAGTIGLGTQSLFEKGPYPISGVVILEGDDDEPSLTHLSARLPPEMVSLIPIIVQQVETPKMPNFSR